LSIGIIFKNEIRCLERCLKSLQPLRDALPCELVMADTGATDGSREVAAKYADILFDFPWINDFAAARNAVMDRCSGTWYMTIDCDEWVDEDIQGFVRFLTTDESFDFASVIIRNYSTLELADGGRYGDFLATRLLRMSTGLRYEGAIHEHWLYEGDLRTMLIANAIFHHDGYVFQDPAKREEKARRNMTLLKERLESAPNDLVVLTQCAESCPKGSEQVEYLRRAITGVKEKWSQWEMFGPPVYCHAVNAAIRDKLPELEEWIHEAETMFPDSIFTRVELAYFAFGHAWNTDNYPEAIRWGERYIQGFSDYESGNFNQSDILATALDKVDTYTMLSVAVVLASGYLHEKQPEKCLRLMESLKGWEMEEKQAGDCARNLCDLYRRFDVDTSSLLLRLWDEISEPKPNQARADQRRNGFLRVGQDMFRENFIYAESMDVN
ncbi:MAG: glycosyltransferase, partial [Oscillospiraceae bacterium]|nr:glycosyltransferase [Oscillospiraceae bacterium]